MTIDELKEKLKNKTKFQKTIVELTISENDYNQLILDGIKTLYIDLNKETQFEEDVNETTLAINTIFTISEIEYIINAASIGYYNVIQTTVNTLYGYSTDALTLTNADKPYANINNEIARLNGRQIELFHKLRASED